MIKIKFASILICVIFISISCKSHRVISLTVIDKITKQPLDSVLVIIADAKRSNGGDSRNNSVTGYTNSNGKFDTILQIGFAFGCNKIYSEYSKIGYSKKSELNKTKGIVELD